MIALLIAATSPELNLRGVTCVAGNVEIHHVARNTGKVLRMVGRGDVPVSIGAARPLQRRLRTAPDTHGPTGTGYVELRGEDRALGTTEYTAIPASRYIGAHVSRHPGEMSIVALGPLTNLAAAVQHGTDLAGSTREVIWMGGTLEERGNTTETGEWNACVDPEATEACLARRRDPSHLPARRHPGRRVHDGGPRRPARNAPDRHRSRRRPVLRRLPSRGRWDRRRVPARPGRADRVAAAPGPGDRRGHRDAGLRHQRRSVPCRQPLSLRGRGPPVRPGWPSPSIPRG